MSEFMRWFKCVVTPVCVIVFALTLTSGQTPSRSNIPPLPTGQAKAGTFRFVALGDTGTGGPGQLAVASQLALTHDQSPFDTVLLLGDNIYPSGDPQMLVQKFERPYADLLKRGLRFHAVLGNHDVALGRQAQLNYGPFNMGGRAYYSFSKGDKLVEFFALDSNLMDTNQLAWFEAACSASKARWKVVFMHHPLYSSARKHGSNPRLQRLLEPIFVRNRVAIVFAGHDHVYERTAMQKGIQYLTAGAGGQLRPGNIDRSSPLFVAGNDRMHSFIYVEVMRDKLTFWAIGENGEVLDGGTLTPGNPVSE